ncbi:MAG TPA: hypothetical protein VFT31_03630 [Kribbella sp.]|nr:hypothetical protein [Kribbella sp.]
MDVPRPARKTDPAATSYEAGPELKRPDPAYARQTSCNACRPVVVGAQEVGAEPADLAGLEQAG